jgi:hypothetical protein
MNVAIAEWMGWTANGDAGLCFLTEGAITQYAVFYGSRLHKLQLNMGSDQRRKTPDFAGSLDAMHKAENKLDADQSYKFHCILSSMCSVIEEFRFAISATAPQRAEALLRTIGKWVES